MTYRLGVAGGAPKTVALIAQLDGTIVGAGGLAVAICIRLTRVMLWSML